jgi:hypothetical protein
MPPDVALTPFFQWTLIAATIITESMSAGSSAERGLTPKAGR